MDNGKILLINPPSPFLTDDLMYPNLGICYLSSMLKTFGIRSEIIDLAGGIDWKILEGHGNVDIIAISSTSAQFSTVKKLLVYIAPLYKNALFVAGGPGPTVAPDDYINVGFDQVVIGEGERAIVQIVKGNRTEKIKAPYIQGIDLIPFPDRSGLDRYHGSATIMTSRGCPWGKCAFCCRTWEGIRFRSAQNVGWELSQIREHGSKTIVLYDMEFFCFAKRDIMIIKMLGDLGFEWRCFSRADYLLKNENLVALASKSGLTEVFIGVESASDDILRAIHKGTTANMNYEAIKLLQKYDVAAKAAIIIGLPGESEKSLDKMERWLDKAKPDTVAPSLLVVMPGCDIWGHPEKYDISFDRKSATIPFRRKPGEYTNTVSTSHLSAERLIEAQKHFDEKYKN